MYAKVLSFTPVENVRPAAWQGRLAVSVKYVIRVSVRRSGSLREGLPDEAPAFERKGFT